MHHVHSSENSLRQAFQNDWRLKQKLPSLAETLREVERSQADHSRSSQKISKIFEKSLDALAKIALERTQVPVSLPKSKQILLETLKNQELPRLIQEKKLSLLEEGMHHQFLKKLHVYALAHLQDPMEKSFISSLLEQQQHRSKQIMGLLQKNIAALEGVVPSLPSFLVEDSFDPMEINLSLETGLQARLKKLQTLKDILEKVLFLYELQNYVSRKKAEPTDLLEIYREDLYLQLEKEIDEKEENIQSIYKEFRENKLAIPSLKDLIQNISYHEEVEDSNEPFFDSIDRFEQEISPRLQIILRSLN